MLSWHTRSAANPYILSFKKHFDLFAETNSLSRWCRQYPPPPKKKSFNKRGMLLFLINLPIFFIFLVKFLSFSRFFAFLRERFCMGGHPVFALVFSWRMITSTATQNGIYGIPGTTLN